MIDIGGNIIMKRILALCISLLLIVSLAACDSQQGDEGNATAPDYFIEHIGVKIEVGADAMPTIIRLGAYTREEGEACGTDEKDVIYTFSGFEIETHVKGGDEFIRLIKRLSEIGKDNSGLGEVTV